MNKREADLSAAPGWSRHRTVFTTKENALCVFRGTPSLAGVVPARGAARPTIGKTWIKHKPFDSGTGFPETGFGSD